MKKYQRELIAALALLAAFILWTAAIRHIDVRAIGPQGSAVGFATLNAAFHGLSGVHMPLYTLTDWLGLVPLCVALCFAALGFAQLVKRKSLFKVDGSILLLGGFYILVMAAYVLFEMIPLNYRPALIEGRLEASYPSSTTLLTLCVMPTAMMQLKARMKNQTARKLINCVIVAFTAFMVLGRLLCGVHWLTDIVGGALLSAGLVALYGALNNRLRERAQHGA